MSRHQPAADEPPEFRDERASRIVMALDRRPIVLVGLMGAGKTSVGKRLAQRLHLDFRDADAEIELAAKMTIADIFETYGEARFRDGERRVMARLLRTGGSVIATGGGAYINKETRDLIRATGLSVWLQAEFEVLMRRVRRRNDRPLLKGPDPDATMKRLIAERYPIYAEADVTVASGDASHEDVLQSVMVALERHLGLVEAAA